MAIKRFFEKLPDNSQLYIFNHEKACGFCVSWAERGTGFGELTVAFDKATGEVLADTEEMGPEWVGTMLERLVGTKVKHVNKQVFVTGNGKRVNREGQSVDEDGNVVKEESDGSDS